MSSTRRKYSVHRQVTLADVGCHCGRAKLSSLFSTSFSRAKPPLKPPSFSSASASASASSSTTTLWDSSNNAATATATSPEAPPRRRRRRTRARSSSADSVAVEKESSEPYLDFRESMVQMIVEGELYGWDELSALLRRLLDLNHPHHHPLILRAFSDVCRAVFSSSSSQY